ncbi:MAG: segregation/condensation protein A, partial [Verrucomicrobia bacterium]|nr:segregation/condensation protein A [Verrucomicrobiota bacterium]
LTEKPVLRFSELFASATTRTEVVVTFLALLELIRLKHLIISQPAPFSEIEISRAPEPAPVAVSNSPAETTSTPLVPDAPSLSPSP